MKLKNILLLIISISFIISCEKNEDMDEEVNESCKVNIPTEAYMLEEESLIFFPYQEEQNIIFKDSMSNEILFEQVEYLVEDLEYYSFQSPCKMTSQEDLWYTYFGKFVIYKCEEINIDTWIKLDVALTEFDNSMCSDCSYDLITYDRLKVSLGEGDDTNLSLRVDNEVKIITSDRSNTFRFPEDIANQDITFYDEIILSNDTFLNVFLHKKSRNSSGRIDDVYYNESGELVAFTDRKDNLWVFDRYE